MIYSKLIGLISSIFNKPNPIRECTIEMPNFEQAQESLDTAIKDISTISASIVHSINTKHKEPRKDSVITEKYEGLSALYEALNTSEDIICLTDAHSRIIYANRAYLITYGFTTTQDVIGRYANIVRSGKTPRSTFKELWEVIRSGKSWDGKIINKTTSGSLVTLQVSIVPITSHVGSIDYYICIQKILPE